mmetsp:Transcript_28857/g.73623  ORF Transcript_28857/g.73623 Transcript_28857/m.73623 type:complete len:203 (-) Transcript_28857:576-1184(-)
MSSTYTRSHSPGSTARKRCSACWRRRVTPWRALRATTPTSLRCRAPTCASGSASWCGCWRTPRSAWPSRSWPWPRWTWRPPWPRAPPTRPRPHHQAARPSRQEGREGRAWVESLGWAGLRPEAWGTYRVIDVCGGRATSAHAAWCPCLVQAGQAQRLGHLQQLWCSEARQRGRCAASCGLTKADEWCLTGKFVAIQAIHMIT